MPELSNARTSIELLPYSHDHQLYHLDENGSGWTSSDGDGEYKHRHRVTRWKIQEELGHTHSHQYGLMTQKAKRVAGP